MDILYKFLSSKKQSFLLRFSFLFIRLFFRHHFFAVLTTKRSERSFDLFSRDRYRRPFQAYSRTQEAIIKARAQCWRVWTSTVEIIVAYYLMGLRCLVNSYESHLETICTTSFQYLENGTTIKLKDVRFEASGSYSCQVSMTTPIYSQASESVQMKVIGKWMWSLVHV